MESQLPERFIRIHKSFIINLDKVKSIGARKVILADVEVPIGDSYRNKLLERLK